MGRENAKQWKQKLLVLTITRVQSYKGQVKVLKRKSVTQRSQTGSSQGWVWAPIYVWGRPQYVLNIKQYYIERIQIYGFSWKWKYFPFLLIFLDLVKLARAALLSSPWELAWTSSSPHGI